MSFNTPNMSYCAAENTLEAVNQLFELLNDGAKNDDIVERSREYEALVSLQAACEDLAMEIEYNLNRYGD